MFVNKTKMWNNFDFSSDCEYILVNLYVCLVKFVFLMMVHFNRRVLFWYNKKGSAVSKSHYPWTINIFILYNTQSTIGLTLSNQENQMIVEPEVEPRIEPTNQIKHNPINTNLVPSVCVMCYKQNKKTVQFLR